MSKIEEAAKPLGFNVHKNNYKMKLKGDKTGRKGHLSVATEVSVTTDGCQAKILPFSGRPGLYIEGSVSPPISGVDIRVVTADNSGDAPLQKGELVLETTIEPDGFFIGRPLYDDADYDIEASKGYGRSLWLMQGMFRANGGCGYVKKPEFLLKVGPHNEVFDPRASLPVKQILKVRVYMGEGWHMDFHHTHFDVYSPPDFYTRVGIGGVFADSVMKKTKTIEDNWTPVWNEEFEFPLTVPELALLCIEVHEYDMSKKDDFGGQICLPLSELRA